MAKQTDDDLFKDSVMTFGEHLEELRRCLWRAVLGVAVGFLLGIWLADYVVIAVQKPMEDALKEYYLQGANDSLRKYKPDATQDDFALIEKRQMIFESVFVEPHGLASALSAGEVSSTPIDVPAEVLTEADLADPRNFAEMIVKGEGTAGRIWSHLNETQQKSVRALATDAASPEDAKTLVQALNELLDSRDLYEAASFGEIASIRDDEELQKNIAKLPDLSGDALRHLNWTLLHRAFPDSIAAPHVFMREILIWRPIENDSRIRTKSLAGQEAFMIWFKAAFVTGFVVASPWVFYQLWTFVAAGLYGHERKFVYIYLPFSIGLFLFGVYMSLFVFEPVLSFFLSFNRSLGIDPEPRISEWLGFVIMLPLGFGVAFQMPLVMLFLERVGIVSVATYLSNWRISVMIIWVASAILTPADPTSIFFLATPLMFLYFGGILLCKWWPGVKRKQ